MNYKEKLKDPRWQKKRLEVLQRENFTCQYCGETTKPLHVHHLCYPKGAEPWEIDDSALLVLCEECHQIEHFKKFTPLEQALLDNMVMWSFTEDGKRIYVQAKALILKHINS